MNLLLLAPSEISSVGRVRLTDHRAQHLLKILNVVRSSTVRVGVLNLGIGRAVVLKTEPAEVELELGDILPAPLPTWNVALAIPRPKGLSRIVSASASFGIRSLTLFNAWKVEKSYLSSPRLAPARLREDLLTGLSQGAQCHLPELRFYDRFSSFLAHHAEQLSAEGEQASRTIVLHPGAAQRMSDAIGDRPGSLYLVFGPDGGFLPREVLSLLDLGAQGVDLGTGPLRTESAVVAALGQLALLRSMAGKGRIEVSLAQRVAQMRQSIFNRK